jgi:hypothetical protein
MPELHRPAAVRRERQPERRDVVAERVVGHDRILDHVLRRRLNPLVDVLAEVAVGPAVETAVLHRGQVIRHEIAAELVALVDHGPQLRRVGFIASPTGLRRPEANKRDLPDATSTSRIAARLVSASMSFSPTLLLEPIEA